MSYGGGYGNTQQTSQTQDDLLLQSSSQAFEGFLGGNDPSQSQFDFDLTQDAGTSSHIDPLLGGFQDDPPQQNGGNVDDLLNAGTAVSGFTDDLLSGGAGSSKKQSKSSLNAFDDDLLNAARPNADSFTDDLLGGPSAGSGVDDLLAGGPSGSVDDLLAGVGSGSNVDDLLAGSSSKPISGFVDTDDYVNVINFPFILKKRDEQFLIKKGDPMVQIIPFKRESWKMWSGFYMEELHAKTINFLNGEWVDRYKKMFWNKKSWK